MQLSNSQSPLVQQLQRGSWCGSVKRSVGKLGGDDARDFLREVAKQSFESGHPKLVDSALTLFPYGLLKTRCRAADTEASIERTAWCEEILQRSGLHTGNQGWEDKRSYLTRKIHAVFETMLSAFGFFDAGNEPSSEWSASRFLYMYGRMLAFPFVVFTGVEAYVASPLTALFLTAVTIGAIAGVLFVYIRWFRPPSEQIGAFRNWTSAARQGQLPQLVGRHAEIQQALFSLGAGMNVVFYGPSGSGKTTMIGGVCQRIASGDVPENLRDKNVFFGNSGGLKGSTFSPDTGTVRFEQVKRRIEGDSNAVMAIDELQGALTGDVGNALLSVTGNTAVGNWQCMGTMTKDDYQKLIAADPVWRRRWPVAIEVKPTDKETTQMILRETLLRQAPHLHASNDELDYIFERTSKYRAEQAQPDVSISVLMQVVAELNALMWDTENRKQLRIESGKATHAGIAYLEADEKDQAEEVDRSRGALANLKAEVAKDDQTIAKRMRLAMARSEAIAERCFLAVQIVALQKKGKNVDLLKKRFVFSQHVLQPYLEQELKELGHPSITRVLVDQFTQEIVKRPARKRPDEEYYQG